MAIAPTMSILPFLFQGGRLPDIETEQIRPYETADREAVLALAPRLTEGVAPWRDPAGVREAVAGWVRESVDSVDDADRVVLVAELAGRVAGFVTAVERRHWSGAMDAYVGELVVDPGAEGQGVGRVLVDGVRDWARARGLGAVTLETGAANVRARAFYAAIGFEEEGVRLTEVL